LSLRRTQYDLAELKPLFQKLVASQRKRTADFERLRHVR
jgi:hypothetical protein